MPQPLRRKDAPIDWDIESVANHPTLSSGVGACILAFAQAEALTGILLVHINWREPEKALDLWAETRTTRGKEELLKKEAAAINAKMSDLVIYILDAFTALAKKRARLAHGVFGIITDTPDRFAWRAAVSPAKAWCEGLAATHMRPIEQETFIYEPRDFAEIAQGCADICSRIQLTSKNLVIINAFIQAYEITDSTKV
tara:strand:+ start:4615 stop:5208 length:594 start_codon:yes stop_codon:yes gene_type:complete